ncbi:MAG: response regulator [Burkholderiales bacterium]|nr:response regulator [Burkholderiales bacterium]
MIHVLLIDDEPSVLTALQRVLRHGFGPGLKIEAFTDGNAALARARDRLFDVALSDLRMPLIDGVALLTRLAAIQPRCVRMLLTASTDFETAQRAINEAGLFRYLVKPWHEAELVGHFDAALAAARAQRAAEHAKLSPQEAECARLEALEPGITEVEWGPNGEVLMPPLDAFEDSTQRH